LILVIGWRLNGIGSLHLARDQAVQASFRREAESAALLNHPSVVAVYDTGEDNSGSSRVPFIVMEFVDGRTIHAQRLRPDQADRAPRARVARKTRDATKGLSVTRLADGDGTITFAGTDYRAGRMWARTFIEVTIVAGSVQLSKDGKVIRLHPIRHDRSRELGAFANPQGRARRKNSAIGMTPGNQGHVA